MNLRKSIQAHDSVATMLRGALLVALMMGALPGSVAAQVPQSVLELVVIDESTGRPIRGAQVIIARVGSAATDSLGIVNFAVRQPIGVEVEIRALGYDIRTLTMDIPLGQTFSLTVPIESMPVFLPGVRVDAAGISDIHSREVADFYRRVRVGTGTYITREDIERRHVSNVDDLFRSLPGFAILTTPAGNKPSLDSKTTASAELFEPEPDCPIQYFLDGSPMMPIHDGVLSAEISISEVEGVEIYRRGSTVPAKFHRFNNTCGVILIWKRAGL